MIFTRFLQTPEKAKIRLFSAEAQKGLKPLKT